MFVRQWLVNSCLFVLGMIGLINYNRSVILILMSLELLILSGALNFILISALLDDMFGQFIGIVTLTTAAAESGIALAIIILYNRQKKISTLYKP